MKNVDPLTDELFLRLVLERQPGAAKSGKKRAVWHEIAQAVNKASGRVVFPSGGSSILRLKSLSTILDDAEHALHGALTREMREMLCEIRGDAEAPEPAARGRVRTRSQTHASGDAASSKPPPAKRARTKQNGDDEGDAKAPAKVTPAATHDAGDDLAAAARPPPIAPMALVPYAALGTQLSLNQFFGAQAERDRQACYEREQLRRELTECKRESAALGREVALLHHGPVRREAVEPVENAAAPGDDGAPLATTMVVRLLEEITTEQRLAREDMQSERASHREQVAAMVALLQQQQQQQTLGRAVADEFSDARSTI